MSIIILLLNKRIQSLSCNVSLLYVCAIAKKPILGGPETSVEIVFCSYTSRPFWLLVFSMNFLVFTNQPTEHNVGVSRERVCGCGVSDR